MIARCPIVQKNISRPKPQTQESRTPEKKGKRPPIPETPDREQYWRTDFPSIDEQRRLGLLEIATSPLFKK